MPIEHPEMLRLALRALDEDIVAGRLPGLRTLKQQNMQQRMEAGLRGEQAEE